MATLRRSLPAYLFVGPALLLLILFVIWPAFFALWVSLQDYGVLGSNGFVGLDNYVQALHDPLFWKSLLVTITYTAGSAVLGLSAALGLAILVSRRLPFMGWFRILYFIPSLFSLVVLAYVFAWMLDYNTGLFNYWLTAAHLPRIPWLQDGTWAMVSLILVGSWGGASYNVPIYAAGLRNVNQELYEAASIDGANPWHKFWYVTLPGIRPITVYTVIMAVIASFQIIASVDVLTNGGPNYATFVTIKYIWRQTWEYLHMGYGSAISVLLLAFLVLITWRQLRFRLE